jgi:catechol 2,3-dioxygenase
MILRLGHVEIFVTNLEKSRDFYVNILGFVEHLVTENHVYLRGIEEFDIYTLVLTQKETAGLGHFGLRVSSEQALDDLIEMHQQLNIAYQIVEAGKELGQGRALRVVDPSGVPIEFYHEFEQLNVSDSNGFVDTLPHRMLHQTKGIPPVRIDHMNIRVPNVKEALTYWQDKLQFSISEFVEMENGDVFAAWTRRFPTTHDVALTYSKDGVAMHHFSYLVGSAADVIKTADILADSGYRDAIDFGPGRHGATNAFFLYLKDPDGNRLEIFTGDYVRDLDREPLKWSLDKYVEMGRLWWSNDYVPESFMTNMPVNKNWLDEKHSKTLIKEM